MKNAISLCFLLIVTLSVAATEQRPDKLLYDDLTLTLNTGWGHPSPLQEYFYQNQIEYPFPMLSTANYRGHIATWVIQNDSFYLKEINIKEKFSSPDKYGIKSKKITNSNDDLVFADWFSGIIECNKTSNKSKQEVISTFYFHIRNGEIITKSEITKKDFGKIKNISARDTADKDLMIKYKSLYLNQNYITYYYRLNQNDEIEYKGNQCKLNTGVERLSPIYALYSNRHLNWPYNWENFEKCGAPHCKWAIINDSLVLKSLQLYSGLRFDSIDKENIELSLLIPGKENNGQVFADWVSGVQLIISGIDTSYGFGYNEFKPKKYTYCLFEKGILIEAYSIPSDYDLDKNEENMDARLKDLMKKYRNHD